jgi:hypothetical protein
MTDQTPMPYPGATATVADLIAMAEEYRRAAHLLLDPSTSSLARAKAPGRYCALHAIELFGNAVSRHDGMKHGEIRCRNHDLDHTHLLDRLVLRTKTRSHLLSMTQGREYLRLRYAPDMLDDLAPVNRLLATLDEVAKKAQAVCSAPRRPGAACDPTNPG